MTVKDWLESDKRIKGVTKVEHTWWMVLEPGYAFPDGAIEMSAPTVGALVQARKTITTTTAIRADAVERLGESLTAMLYDGTNIPVAQEPEPEPAPPTHTMEDAMNRYAVYLTGEHIPTSVAAYSLEDLRRRLHEGGRLNVERVCVKWQDVTKEFMR